MLSRHVFKMLPTLAVVTLLTAAPAAQIAAASPLAQSTFASGADGWTSAMLPYPSAVPPTILDLQAPAWVSSLGGYIELADPDGSQPTGEVQYWMAPSPYLGFKSAAYGGALEFDLANVGSFPVFAQEDVILVGGGLTLVHDLGSVPAPTFTHYTIPLDENGWTVGGSSGPAATQQQMLAVLFDVEQLFVRAEYRNGPDTQFLDDVTLSAGPNSGPWTNLGFGLGGVSGIPNLVGTGPLTAGSPTGLALSNARPSAPAYLFLSLAVAPTPFKGGMLVTVPVDLALALGTDGVGGFQLSWTWPAGIPSGAAIAFQCGVQDPAGPYGVSLSNALLAVTP